jgi:hypothetical protein
VADPVVIQGDLVGYVIAKYRTLLHARPEPDCSAAVVRDREPSPGDDWPDVLVVVRDDGGPDTSILTGERSVSVVCLLGTKDNPTPAMNLARIVHALRVELPGVGSAVPVSAVVGSSGPIFVPESEPQARAMVQLTLAVAGDPL